MDNAFLTWLKSAVIFGIVFGLNGCDKLNSPKSTNTAAEEQPTQSQSIEQENTSKPSRTLLTRAFTHSPSFEPWFVRYPEQENLLRDLYEGIFAKSFTLFYGETLRYYFESVTGERVNRTQERVLTMNKIEGTPVSKYHMINQMLSARRLDKKKEVFSQVKKYLRQEQYVKKMFVIEKEEQEQIVLKPGGTNERNS